MFDAINIPTYWSEFLSFNNIYNFIYGIVIIAIICGILFKSDRFFRETHQKKIIFFASMFFVSAMFELLHILVIFDNSYIEFLNVFLNRFYQCIALLGILFIRENPPQEKATWIDFVIPVGSFLSVLSLETFLFESRLIGEFFPNLLNSMTSFLFISLLASFIFMRLLQKKSVFTVFNFGILFLAASSMYLINEDYYASFYRHLIHVFRILGNLCIFLGLCSIKDDFQEYRFRLKLILWPNLYMILFFVIFVLLGNFLFNLNFTEDIYLSFLLFYCLCLVVQFIFISRLIDPITKITHTLATFKPGEKPGFIDIKSHDEVGALAQNMNRVFKKEWEYTNEIKEKQKQIKELIETRDAFIASLSHDLKSPIFSEQKIIEFILMDRDAIKISDFIEYLEEMYKINDEVLRIVNNLLTSYHMDSNEFELDISPTNLNSLIKDATKTLMHLAKDEQIELQLSLAPQIPLVNVDEDMIRRVIINLISNAIKHSHKAGELKISTCRDKNGIKVSVQDFGKGISIEDQKNIFQKYPTIKRKIGTGLGLYISKQIVEAHNGKIWFESEEGVGTTFYFLLPI